jgi:very-short-patch-repair endonuclease
MQSSHDKVTRYIRSHGGVLSYRELDAAGISRNAVAAAIEHGAVQRIRRGWFATPDASPDVVRASRVGGTLTAASALRLAGAWMLEDSLLHVRVPSSTGRLRNPDASGEPLDRTAHRVCLHYRTRPIVPGARDPLSLAIAEMLACADERSVIVAIDSAVARGLMTAEGLAESRAFALPSKRSVFDRVHVGSESGIETMVRLLLRAHGILHRTQMHITRVGNVDLLVGDRLVIEVDGEGFHTGPEFEADRRRDFELVMQGYLVLRLSYRMVLSDWDVVSRGVLELVRRGEHRWGSRSRPEAGLEVSLRRPDSRAYA